MILKTYSITLDKIDIRLVSSKVNTKGVENTIEEYLKSMDCTIVYPDGARPRQTINYGYKLSISSIYFILDTALNRETPLIDNTYYDVIIHRMIDMHKINIEYEKLNTPIVYSRKTKNTKSINSKIKDTIPSESKDKVRKPTKAELKLAEKVSKLNKLSMNFKIKTVDKDDTI